MEKSFRDKVGKIFTSFGTILQKLDVAESNSENNPEIIIRQALINTAYIGFDGQKYGMTLSVENSQLYEKALAIAPNNPRVVFNKADWNMNSAKYFGKDTAPYCQEIEASIELFDTIHNKILWSDHWYEDTKNLYKIKSNVAEGILRVLEIDVNNHKDLCNTAATISEAYSLYLKGKYIFQHDTRLSKLKLSEKYLKKALAIDNKLLKAQLLLGDVLQAQNKFKKALTMYNDCLNTSKDMGRKIEIARSLSSIGDIYASKKEFSSAYDFQHKSLQIREEVDDIKGIY